MQFNLNVKNFGKLEDAKVRINNFTVFAGPNNTGKSSVSKLLYSFFNAMNANHAAIMLNSLLAPMPEALRQTRGALQDVVLHSPIPEPGDKILDSVKQIVKHLREINEYAIDIEHGNDNNRYKDEIEAFENIYPAIKEKVEEVKKLSDRITKITERLSKEPFRPDAAELQANIERRLGELSNLRRRINELHERIVSTEPNSFITNGFELELGRNLFLNFQVDSLSFLSNKKDKNIAIEIANIAKFEIANDDDGTSSISITEPRSLQEYSRVIYLESPVYWKLKNALENMRIQHRSLHSSRRESLDGVPNYFYELAYALREKYIGSGNFQDLFETLTGKEVLGGKLAISELGELMFQENDRSFPLSLTAMGVANLGLLALLLERKVIEEGSFVFIDEPEAHLHPAWQIVMVETLFALSRRGVNVVIATHSADILKWLEVHVKENPADKKQIALNHFTPQGVEEDERDFEIKLASIKKSLTEPFSNLYMKGLRL